MSFCAFFVLLNDELLIGSNVVSYEGFTKATITVGTYGGNNGTVYGFYVNNDNGNQKYDFGSLQPRLGYYYIVVEVGGDVKSFVQTNCIACTRPVIYRGHLYENGDLAPDIIEVWSNSGTDFVDEIWLQNQ